MTIESSSEQRISFFIQDFAGGGAERMIINLANAIAIKNDKYIVDLLVVRNQGPYKELVNNKINIITIGRKKVLYSIWPLSRYLKNEKPDILYSTLKHVNIAAIIANKLSGSKSKVVIREACHLLMAGNKQLLQKIAYRLVPFFYKRADAVVAVSDGVAESIVEYCNIPYNKIHVLPNPSVTDELIEKSEDVPNHPYFMDENSKVILGVGRLTYQKNFDSLIRAFSIFKKNSNDNVKLIILGDGEDRAMLEKLIENLDLGESVSLPGFVDNPYSYMKQASLFVLSSRFEGSPNVLVEAMACGTPVVSTDCPSGPKQILKEGTFGQLLPIGDEIKLSEAISQSIHLKNSEDHIRKLQKRAMDYHVDRSVNEYLRIFEKK